MATVGPRTGPNSGAEALALAAELQGEATCSICLEFFREPVSVECGHSFCRACIMRCWERPGAGTGTVTRTLPCPLPCPQCREPARPSQLRPNRQLAAVASLLRRFSLPPTVPGESGTPAVAAPAAAARCPQHGEQLKLYCQDDGRAICVVCDRAREHRSHAVLPLEEAVQEAKVGVGCPGALALLQPSQLSLQTAGGVLQKSPVLLFSLPKLWFPLISSRPSEPHAWLPGRRPQGLDIFCLSPTSVVTLPRRKSLSRPHIPSFLQRSQGRGTTQSIKLKEEHSGVSWIRWSVARAVKPGGSGHFCPSLGRGTRGVCSPQSLLSCRAPVLLQACFLLLERRAEDKMD